MQIVPKLQLTHLQIFGTLTKKYPQTTHVTKNCTLVQIVPKIAHLQIFGAFDIKYFQPTNLTKNYTPVQIVPKSYTAVATTTRDGAMYWLEMAMAPPTLLVITPILLSFVC